MKNDKKNDPDSRAIENEVRAGRGFELSDAIGRENSDVLKGGSPVTRNRQVLAEIEHLLEIHLRDSEGSLLRTILARLQDNAPLLGRHHAEPTGALAEFIATTVDSPRLLAALVRDTDARWGREYQERPHFETEGKPPAADDPYTLDSVRTTLDDLARCIAG